jgi:hypothetical protein
MDKNRGVWLTVLGLIQGPNKAVRKKGKKRKKWWKCPHKA